MKSIVIVLAILLSSKKILYSQFLKKQENKLN